MSKYILYRDYKAGHGPAEGCSYTALQASSLEDAIEIADSLHNDAVYLSRIMRKEGKTEKEEGGWKAETYTAVLARRSAGWHKNTAENAEGEHKARRHVHRCGIEYTECI